VPDRGRIHRHAEAFGLVPEAYERGRPEYPAAAVEVLVDRLGLGHGVRVLDLAAGTGKLTRALLATGAAVVAVEPVAEMRALLPDGIEALDGVAEAIPLPDEDVDAITCGQAFHWFRAEEALPEMRRVLRRGGGLALVANTRDETDELHRTITDLTEAMRVGTPAWRDRTPAEAIDASGLFGSVELVCVPNQQELTIEQLLDRFLSISFIAAATQAEREAFAGSLRELVHDRPEPIVLPYVTEIYLATRR
jgi:SAM-dependent methyltransferase